MAPVGLGSMVPTSHRYAGPLLEDGALPSAVKGGLGSLPYVDLVISLCTELKSLLDTQETVTRPAGR